MKVSVRVRGEWFAVPCGNGKQTIEWLGTEAVSKYMKLSKMDSSNVKDHNVAVIRRTQGGAILDPSDTISTVLDDNDFLTIVLESDILAPESEHDPPHILYVPERLHGKHKVAEEFLALDGNSLSTDELLHLGYGDYKIRLTTEAENEVIKSRKIVDEIVEQNKVVYGITTGFGKFAKVSINKENLKDLQKNLIRSHAAGIGQPLSPENTRMLLALRINVLAKGYSGISLKTLKSLIEAFNADCLPWVPEKGTVGASGDLAPLSHLALGMMGEGKMWCPNSGWGDAKYVLESNNLKPIELQTKEGLALINGTQLITSLGAAAVERAGSVARQADVVAALTLDVLKGSSRAFDAQVHKIRPHKGQIMVAGRLRSLLHSEFYKSEIAESHRFCNRVQDAYTLRCCPQVHGISHETIDFVKGIITTEMNSATDNPLIMSQTNETISAGNFHGEYPAKALDYLAIAVHELANMSERRIERLVNPALSELPAFLVKDGGLNSGFMIGHCAAASLVSENKVLCHPASIDSLSTSAGTEDHVSMGGFSARKALSVVDNVEHVIAIELLAACQAIEFLRPLKTTAPLEAVYKLVRTVAKPWDKDRYMAPDIEAVTKLIKQEKVWETVKGYIESYNSQKIVETHPFSPTAMANCPPSKKRRTTSRNNNNNK